MWRRLTWRSERAVGSWSMSQLAKIRRAVSAETTTVADPVADVAQVEGGAADHPGAEGDAPKRRRLRRRGGQRSGSGQGADAGSEGDADGGSPSSDSTGSDSTATDNTASA